MAPELGAWGGTCIPVIAYGHTYKAPCKEESSDLWRLNWVHGVEPAFLLYAYGHTKLLVKKTCMQVLVTHVESSGWTPVPKLALV